MKYLTKIGLIIGLLGSIAGLIICSVNHTEMGSYGVVAFVASIVLFGLLLILPWLLKQFDIEYSKKDGLKITEEK